MPKPPAIWISVFVLAAGLVGIAGYKRYSAYRKPLGESARIEFPKSAKSAVKIETFLANNFVLIDLVESLPEPVWTLYREKDGSKFTMANPGKEFLATDVIYDASIPRRRLIVAGVTAENCFVRYEQGGIGLSNQLARFELNQPKEAKPFWEGYCGDYENQTARGHEALRGLISRGECRDRKSTGR